MHIEPGIVDGARMALAHATAAGVAGYGARLAYQDIARSSPVAFGARSLLAVIAVLGFFEALPHFPVGVSEVHFILGTTLFLVLGAAPAAAGLALGLLVQGVVFAPADLPMYFVNVTTLLVPLLAVSAMAGRLIPARRAFVDLRYSQVLKMSGIYQGGVVAWVAFWVFYGQGVSAETLASVWSFGAAYMLVIIIEPVVDLVVLATAKAARNKPGTGIFNSRLFRAA